MSVRYTASAKPLVSSTLGASPCHIGEIFPPERSFLSRIIGKLQTLCHEQIS